MEQGTTGGDPRTPRKLSRDSRLCYLQPFANGAKFVIRPPVQGALHATTDFTTSSRADQRGVEALDERFAVINKEMDQKIEQFAAERLEELNRAKDAL